MIGRWEFRPYTTHTNKSVPACWRYEDKDSRYVIVICRETEKPHQWKAQIWYYDEYGNDCYSDIIAAATSIAALKDHCIGTAKYFWNKMEKNK